MSFVPRNSDVERHHASVTRTQREQMHGHMAVFKNLAQLESKIIEAAALVSQAVSAQKKVMLCGNCGSAADSQHIAAEFVGRFVKDRPALPALALSTDTSALTCIGNDYGFEEVFRRQVEALGAAGDVLVAISTSRNSENVLRAVEAARDARIHTIGLLGRDGGRLAAMVDVALIVPSDTTARIQESHIFIGHALCSLVEANLGYA